MGHFGQRAAMARMLIRRALAAVEVELGEPMTWRLLQLLGAVERFKLGQFEASTLFAARAMLPRRDIPAAQAGFANAPSLGAVRHQVNAL